MNFRYLALGSLIFSLGGAWLFSVVYDVDFSLVVFIVLQCLLIILATMIWPALNSVSYTHLTLQTILLV